MDGSYTVVSDFEGRIDNVSLAPTPANSIVPLLEAITNSIQSIEERFGAANLSQGRIEIYVLRNDKEPFGIIGLRVDDNGVGFNEKNLQSFRTSDSRYKIKKGGKGVGRFMWLKVFETANINSRFGDGPDEQISFDFVLSDANQIRNVKSQSNRLHTGTSVYLIKPKSSYAAHFPSRPETLQAKIISHFLPYFMNKNAPKITVIDNTTVDLSYEFSSLISDNFEKSFTIEYGEETYDLVFNGFLLPKRLSDDEKGINAIFYGANGRSVLRVPIDTAIGMSAIDGQFAFFGFVTGQYLDDHVNQERTNFSWSDELKKQIHDKAMNFSKEYLSDEIKKIKDLQEERTKKIVSEHLRFMTIARNVSEFVEDLDLSKKSEEDIYLELSRKVYRKEKEVRREYAKAKRISDKDITGEAKKFAKELTKESLASLAEYIYKRKLILNTYEDRISYAEIDDKRYQIEEVVHQIICPLRSTDEDLDYEDHNLWIIDDELAFYSYFNSDKTLKSITGEKEASTKEPDLTFFDLGLGFERSGTMEPVSIIEFKRPGRDNYTLADNPIVQIRDYCTKLREAKRVVSQKGRELRGIDDGTPFMGHIIADLKPSLLAMMKQFGPFAQKAGHSCYYKWDEDFRMFIQIQSYADVLKGAKARNEAFFRKLGISN